MMHPAEIRLLQFCVAATVRAGQENGQTPLINDEGIAASHLRRKKRRSLMGSGGGKFSRKRWYLGATIRAKLQAQFPTICDALAVKLMTTLRIPQLRECVATKKALYDALRLGGLDPRDNPILWPWVVKKVLQFLDTKSLINISATCRIWGDLIAPTSANTQRSSQTPGINANAPSNGSMLHRSLFVQSLLRHHDMEPRLRIRLWQHTLSPCVRGGNGLLMRNFDNEDRLQARYDATRSLLKVIDEEGALDKAVLGKIKDDLLAIDRDVRRTFGKSTKVKGVETSADFPNFDIDLTLPERIERLRRVLETVVARNPDVGYCQGMDSLAKQLLILCNWHEAKAFCLLRLLLEERGLDSVYCEGMPRIHVIMHQFKQLIQQKLPKLSEHLQNVEVDVSMFAWPWFMTLFCDGTVVNFHMATIVLDMFVLSGWSWPVSIALALLEPVEDVVVGLDFEETIEKLQSLGKTSMRAMGNYTYASIIDRANSYKITNSLLNSLQPPGTVTEKSARETNASSARTSPIPIRNAQAQVYSPREQLPTLFRKSSLDFVAALQILGKSGQLES